MAVLLMNMPVLVFTSGKALDVRSMNDEDVNIEELRKKPYTRPMNGF